MRATFFRLCGDQTAIAASELHNWEPAVHDGQTVPLVEQVVLHEHANATILLIRMSATASFPMHTGPDYAFCQVVEGRGKVGFPDGREFDYAGPELFVFEPGTLHDWHGISEDTLLAICLTRDGQPPSPRA